MPRTINSILIIPDLAEIQKKSFKLFLEDGLTDVLESFPIIADPTGNLELQLFGKDYKLKFPRHSVRKAKSRDRTYSAQIYIPCKLTRKEMDLVKKIQLPLQYRKRLMDVQLLLYAYKGHTSAEFLPNSLSACCPAA